MEEIEEDTHEWKNCCVHGSEELILLKCTTAQPMQSQPKFQWNFSHEQKNNYPNICMYPQLQIAKTIMKNKSKAAGITFSDFMLYTARVINQSSMVLS